MKKFLPAAAVLLAWCANPAASSGEAKSQQKLAYAGTWHVVENLGTGACYRVHGMEPRDGWRDFGEFNTFRMAGAWIWQHRDLCRSSPVFE